MRLSRLTAAIVPTLSFVLPVISAACVDDMDRVLAKAPKVPQARFGMGEAGGALPGLLDVPFPSDIYMVSGRFTEVPGVERIVRRSGKFLASQLAGQNGWSRIAPVLFVIDDPGQPAHPDSGESATALIDEASLPADEAACAGDASPVFLVDLETGARVPCRASVHDESEAENGRSSLAVGPARGVVLAEGHRYAAVLTSRLRDVKGRGVEASPEFVAAAVRNEGPLAAVYRPAYEKVTAALGDALAGTEIIAVSPYTTQTAVEETYAMREAIEAAPAPKLVWDAAAVAPMGAVKFASAAAGPLPAGFTATLDAWLGVTAATAKLEDGTDDPDDSLPVRAHDAIEAVGTAVFEATNFLRVKPDGYEDLEHATLSRDASGKPISAPEKPTSKIWVTLAVPKAPMPADGYPVVIVQHGMGGSRTHLLALANTFAKKGWMSVAIDSVTFGARATKADYQVDAESDWSGAPGATYAGPDGFSDAVKGQRAGSFDLFGGLRNLGALRDQFRQAALDTASLVKLLRAAPDLAPLATRGPAPKIDPDRIAYAGDSLGGIQGAAAAALEPHVKAWTLNVAGAGIFLELAAHGPAVNAQLALAGSVNFGFRNGQYDEAHPLVAIGQTIGEAGDPIAYADKLVTAPHALAGAATKPRNIFQIEVIYDELVANEANEALARAGGWKLATPNVGPNSGVGSLDGTPYRGGSILLPTVDPDEAGDFRDTPVAGTTALLVQVSPAGHGSDLHSGHGTRQYRAPFNDARGRFASDRMNGPFRTPSPYRALQSAMVRFFDEAFAGKVPTLRDLPAPVRDVDGDGALDAVDRAPFDSAEQ